MQTVEINDLLTLYTKERKSCRAISCYLKSNGVLMSENSVYQKLKNIGIIRTRVEAALNSNNNCDYLKSFIDKSMIEIVDGFMLGDGHIQQHSANGSGRFAATLKEKCFCDYWVKAFRCYDPIARYYTIQNDRYNHSFGQWVMQTKSHPDITKQKHRWYPDGQKRVPNDVVLTPLLVALWYCGDGTRARSGNSVWSYLCTQGFTEKDVEFLVNKLSIIGIDCHRTSKNKIYITTKGFPELLHFMGDCPIECYEYKFQDD